MLECNQCGCQNELAVGLVWESQKAQVVCLACEAMYDLPKEDYGAHIMMIEAAKQRAIEYQNPSLRNLRLLSSDEIVTFDETELPF